MSAARESEGDAKFKDIPFLTVTFCQRRFWLFMIAVMTIGWLLTLAIDGLLGGFDGQVNPNLHIQVGIGGGFAQISIAAWITTFGLGARRPRLGIGMILVLVQVIAMLLWMGMLVGWDTLFAVDRWMQESTAPYFSETARSSFWYRWMGLIFRWDRALPNVSLFTSNYSAGSKFWHFPVWAQTVRGSELLFGIAVASLLQFALLRSSLSAVRHFLGFQLSKDGLYNDSRSVSRELRLNLSHLLLAAAGVALFMAMRRPFLSGWVSVTFMYSLMSTFAVLVLFNMLLAWVTIWGLASASSSWWRYGVVFAAFHFLSVSQELIFRWFSVSQLTGSPFWIYNTSAWILNSAQFTVLLLFLTSVRWEGYRLAFRP